MCPLDSCSRAMSSKRLIREGLTYDLLKTVFQKCSSYMDFWQTLKKIGIDRKVAKHFTSQFGAMGLENQGSLGYNLNAAMQNGSLSNGSSQDTNGHANGAVNGNSGPNEGNSVISVSSKSRIHTTNMNETDSSKRKDVLRTTRAERATSSSRAFEERPLDYAVTSSADERLKAYELLRSAKEQDNKKDASKNVKVASGRERKSSLEANAGAESTMTGSLSSENTSNSTDPSICNGDENWDSEIENSITRGHFVLQFNEVIPASIVFDDVCSSPGESSTEPTHPEAMQEKRNVGNVKDSASYDKRKTGGGIGSVQGKRHEHGHAKRGSELVDLGRSNKTMKKETKNKSKDTVVSSQDRKQEILVSSAGKESLEQVSHNRSVGHLPKVTDGESSKTSSSSVVEVGQKEIDDKKGLKTNKRSKISSRKKPSSVTFVTPVGRASEDSSSGLPEDGVVMTTVYVGDVPILVPVKRQCVPCEDSLDQPTHENKELDTGNGNISTEGSTIPREEGITTKEESVRNPTTDAERMVVSEERKDGTSVDRELEDGRKQEMSGFEQVVKDLEKAPPENTTIPDIVPPTSTSESLSSSSYETSDTGSNIDYKHQTTPRLTEENLNEPGKPPSNLCPSGDNVYTHGSCDQASPAIEQAAFIHQPAAPTTEEHSSCAMETEDTSKTDQDSENVCGDDESQPPSEQRDLSVDPSSEVDIIPDVATQEQMNGFPEGQWTSSDVVYPNPNMYSVPRPQYPFQMPYPTAMPSAYGFYPPLPHMMPMIPGPQPVPYPPMPFASQGMMPFGGFPPRFPMPMPMFRHSMYPTVQQGPQPYLDVSEQESTPQTSSSSPEVLGIPDNRIQASEHQNNKSPTGMSYVAYSTSSDDHSARSSPFPVDDGMSSGKTTPLTTPHRSPTDDNSPGALSSSDKGEKEHLTQDRRKGYRKDTRPARFYTDERSRRSNRNVPWKGSSYRENVNKKGLSEKVSRDLAEAPKARGSDGASEERKKTKASDGPLKEDQHSSRYVRDSSDQHTKLDSNSPKRSSKSPKSEQLTPPRREERDVKSKQSTSTLSPNNSRDVQSDHGSTHASPTKSRSEKTPPRKVERDHSPKTSRRDTRSERSEPPRKEERNISADPAATQQMSPSSSKSDQASSIKSAQSNPNKSQGSVGINKQFSKESQKSSHTSNLHAPPSKPSSQVQAHPSNSTSSDGAPKVAFISPKDDAAQSLVDSVALPSSMSDKKNDNLVSSEKDPKPQNQKDGANVTPPVSRNKEAKHHPDDSRNPEARNMKWPQSALATQKFKEPPKPQREQSSRRRIRDSHGSGSEREKRVQYNRQGVAPHRNEDVKGQPGKPTDPTAGENNFKDSKTATEKIQSKEPFSASGKDLKTKSDDRVQKNSTGRSDSKRSVNYRDVLLGKQSTKANANESSSLKTNATASSDGVKEGSSCAMEPRPHPQAAPAKEKNQVMRESGTTKNPRGTPQPGDQEKTYRKEYRKDKEPSEKQSYEERRAVSAARGSTISREPAPRTRNPTRYRHYDTNNNNNFQSRNTASKATKS